MIVAHLLSISPEVLEFQVIKVDFLYSYREEVAVTEEGGGG